MKTISVALLALLWAMPSQIIGSLAITAPLPFPFDLSREIFPPSFGLYWVALPAIAALRLSGEPRWQEAGAAASVLGVSAGMSYVISLYSGYQHIDAWLPLCAGALGVLAFAFSPKAEVGYYLNWVMVCNALTLPFVLALRIAEGGEFLRLNAFGLNANATGLLFSLWFLWLSFCPNASPGLSVKLRRGLVAVAILVVLASGSRTALIILAVGVLYQGGGPLSGLASPSRILLILLASVVFWDRVGQGEDYSSHPPPDFLRGTVFEHLSVLGRWWSLLTGVGAIGMVGFSGTQSVYRAIETFQDLGYPTFAHSTFLMLFLVYGMLGLFVAICFCMLVWSTAMPTAAKLAFLALLSLSGGLVTNGKEIALTVVILLAMRERSLATTPTTSVMHGRKPSIVSETG